MERLLKKTTITTRLGRLDKEILTTEAFQDKQMFTEDYWKDPEMADLYSFALTSFLMLTPCSFPDQLHIFTFSPRIQTVFNKATNQDRKKKI